MLHSLAHPFSYFSLGGCLCLPSLFFFLEPAFLHCGSDSFLPMLPLRIPSISPRCGCIPFSFGKGGSGVLANYTLCGTKATLSFSAGPVCSCVSTEACAVLHALCWFRKHQQVCHFSSFPLLSDYRSVFATRSSTPSFYFMFRIWLICLPLHWFAIVFVFNEAAIG